MLQLSLWHHHRTAEVGRGPWRSPCLPPAQAGSPTAGCSGPRRRAGPALPQPPSSANPIPPLRHLLRPFSIAPSAQLSSAGRSWLPPPRYPPPRAATRSLGTGTWANPAWQRWGRLQHHHNYHHHLPPRAGSPLAEPHLRRPLLQPGHVQPHIARTDGLGRAASAPALHPRQRAGSGPATPGLSGAPPAGQGPPAERRPGGAERGRARRSLRRRRLFPPRARTAPAQRPPTATARARGEEEPIRAAGRDERQAEPRPLWAVPYIRRGAAAL